MNSPIELSLKRINLAIEDEYSKIEASRNRIEGMQIIKNILEKTIYEEDAAKKLNEGKQ